MWMRITIVRQGVSLLSEPLANLAITACAAMGKEFCHAQWNAIVPFVFTFVGRGASIESGHDK